ncbi:hypothetical protein H072_1044 [Dactylellina haptotyla CBS 200.50]|uniref:Uncharacterized protein n=1 Tax=Dactylellina haptotyla (strain CBS 200.50) TaxID=1284197 RepID=S8APQ8_DACHA|nr:hypothetical protein H072_1044 [Dactylellina haptotyla CBS 200.50]
MPDDVRVYVNLHTVTPGLRLFLNHVTIDLPNRFGKDSDGIGAGFSAFDDDVKGKSAFILHPFDPNTGKVSPDEKTGLDRQLRDKPLEIPLKWDAKGQLEPNKPNDSRRHPKATIGSFIFGSSRTLAGDQSAGSPSVTVEFEVRNAPDKPAFSKKGIIRAMVSPFHDIRSPDDILITYQWMGELPSCMKLPTSVVTDTESLGMGIFLDKESKKMVLMLVDDATWQHKIAPKVFAGIMTGVIAGVGVVAAASGVPPVVFKALSSAAGKVVNKRSSEEEYEYVMYGDGSGFYF